MELFRSAGLAATPERISRLSSEERGELRQYARDTWRSFERLAQPSGLPADSLVRQGDVWGPDIGQTSPTNIAAYIWSVLAAQRLKLISAVEGKERLGRTLETLSQMERYHGFYFNDLDARTGRSVKVSPLDPAAPMRVVSSVDNAWLATALLMVANLQPALRPQAAKLLDAMNFRFFYDPYDAADPVNHPGFLRVGYWADHSMFYGHYGMLNSESRIVSYLGIARKQLPRDEYFRMYRALPAWLDELGRKKPEGQLREYLGVKVIEGGCSYRGVRLVPSWGGSMFEALMVTLFVPEDVWAPRSWGVNHPLYVQAQIEYGLKEARFGFWGFSPSTSPHGGYKAYGVKALGAAQWAYDSDDKVPQMVVSHPSHTGGTSHGVVTPYASFLALRYAPREALANLHGLMTRFPIYGPCGFHDSVDVAAGVVSNSVLAVDQGMIMAAIANELADDVMQHAFSDGAVEETIRPLISVEEFSAGRIGEVARAQPHQAPK
jgi:hypothetical protein